MKLEGVHSFISKWAFPLSPYLVILRDTKGGGPWENFSRKKKRNIPTRSLPGNKYLDLAAEIVIYASKTSEWSLIKILNWLRFHQLLSCSQYLGKKWKRKVTNPSPFYERWIHGSRMKMKVILKLKSLSKQWLSPYQPVNFFNEVELNYQKT